MTAPAASGGHAHGLTGPGPIARALRVAAGIVVGGAATAVVFLVMVQGAARQGYTNVLFNRGLGELITREERGNVREEGALGLIGDPTGPRGFYATVIASMVLLAVHALVIVPLVRRRWYVQALPLAVLAYAALAFVYAPLVGSRVDEVPGGVLFLDASPETPLVMAACALGFGIVGARCYSLMRGPRWWEAKHEGLQEGLAGLVLGGHEPSSRPSAEPTQPPSFELPEQGGEDRGVEPRG